MTPAKLFASVFGIGYLGKGSGSVAAGLGVAIWYFFDLAQVPLIIVASGVALLCGIGVVVANAVEPFWGEDSGKVVVDELAGMGIALLALPAHWTYYFAAFVIFRILDIAKPFGIARMENLHGGWGVMGDDILAGIYTNIALQLFALAVINI